MLERRQRAVLSSGQHRIGRGIGRGIGAGWAASLSGWLLLFLAAALWGPGPHPVQAQEETTPPQLGAQLVKSVTADPAACGTATSIDAAPGATIYVCYTLTNTGTLAIDPLTLIDHFGSGADELIAWQKPPGFLLEPGAMLAPTLDNGLIHPVTVSASRTSSAAWGVVSADGAQTAQITSNNVTINVVTLGLQATLTGSTAAGTSPTVNCAAPSVSLTSYQSPVYLCVTLSNASSITLTQHHISIPGFAIDINVTKSLGPSGSATTPIRITNADNAALAPRLSLPTMTSRAYITSTNAISGNAASLSVSAVTEPVVVTGPAAAVQMQKFVNTVPEPCGASSTLSNLTPGQTFYYCLALINTASLTYTVHEFSEPALKIAGSFNAELRPGGRITVTNNTLSGLNVTPFLGPFTATTSINNSMVYTASNPSAGYRAVYTTSASITVLTPTPTNTGAPTPTYTPLAFETPIPSPTITPIPATPTPTWTWTPSRTPTPLPTVLVFSTPGGQPPTPYPTLAGLQPSTLPNQFVSPLDPFAGTATAQALGFAFPTPVLDPFAATATAQAQFAFPTPVLDPFAATATAQAQFAFPTPVLDPFAATATAQALGFAFPTPVLDPFAATATAQALGFAFPTPVLDPFAATATAQAQMMAPVSPLATPELGFVFPTPMLDPAAATATAQALLSQGALAPDTLAATAIAQAATISAAMDAGAAAPPAEFILVTATFTPPLVEALAQRPVQPPAAAEPAVDARSFFVRVLESAGSTVALLWFLGGSVIFFVTAGVLAGLSFRAKEQGRFVLENGRESDDFVAQPTPDEPVAMPSSDQGSAKTRDKADDNWPAALP